MPQYDAIVVGAGIAGLTAAAYLAAAGRSTLLLEQADVVGGCTHVFRRQRKWEFEVGVHYLGDCGPGGQIPTILGGLGLNDRIEFLPLDPDGFDTLHYPGLRLGVPVGWDRYLEHLVEALPEHEDALRRWVTTLRAISRGLDRDESLRDPLSMRHVVRHAGLASRWAMQPMNALMDACGLHGRARSVVSTQFCAYACPPSRAPVALHAGFLENYVGRGAYYPRGGGQVMAANLVEAIKANGGAVRTRASVERILVAGGAVHGVRLADGEQLRAPVVVSAADLKQTFLSMVGTEHLRRRTVARTHRARMSSPWMNVYLGVDLDLRSVMPAGNIFVFPTWDPPDEVHRDLVDRAHLRTREAWINDAAQRLPAFVHCGSAKDPTNPRLAPAGHSVLEALTPMPADPRFWGAPGHQFAAWDYKDSRAYEEIKAQATEILIDRATAAVPELAGHIVYQETATPLTQQRYTRTTEGSAYGVEFAGREFGPFRQGPATEINGLFLAGCSGRWGPAVEGSMLSGMNAAGAVLGRRLGREIRAGAVLGQGAGLPAHGPTWDPLAASKRMSKKRHGIEVLDSRRAASA